MKRYPRIYPQYSTVKPEDVYTKVRLAGHTFSLPIMSDPIAEVTELAMSESISKAGGLPAIHNSMPIEDNVLIFEAARKRGILGVSVRFGDSLDSNRLSQERAGLLLESGATLFVIESDMPASEAVAVEVNKMLASFGDKASLIVKNMPNERALKDFHDATRKKVAAYILGPYISDLGDRSVKSVVSSSPVDIIISDFLSENEYPVNVTEALMTGAKMVMLSNYLAASDEAPGNIVVDEQGRMCKSYSGGLKKYVGPVSNVLDKIRSNLQEDMRLMNVNSLEALWLQSRE